MRFDLAANSFFSILVFNDRLRGPEQGSMALMPAGVNAPGYSNLPVALNASLKQLAIEKLPSSEQFDLAVRDAKTGFTFFNIEGHQYDYDAGAQLLTVNGGRLTMSRDFAIALGRPSDVGALVGKISIGATMQPVEINELANGELKAVTMPPLHSAAGVLTPTATHGPDVIVGDLPNLQQFGSAGTQVGLAVATTSCNNGDQPLDWLQLPQTDHPVIPQNLYRMSSGADNTERFEQIGQSWLKHAFFALEDDACNFGCNTNGCSTGSHLCPGCSDPYSADLNGNQSQIGSRAWVNPFTGSFPSNADDHSGHSHNGVSHRILVEVDDLNTTLNQGASYFAEAQYVTPYARAIESHDRAIQACSVPLGATANISNIGCHAPPQHPGWSNDGTLNSQGYSSTPWMPTQTANSLTWNCETFAQNQNANAIRWGTLYNFRFDADQPPQATNATVDFFKTGSPMPVAIQAPVQGGTPTPTPTPTITPTHTHTTTPRPTPTPRTTPIPRNRPTPLPRPSP